MFISNCESGKEKENIKECFMKNRKILINNLTRESKLSEKIKIKVGKTQT